MLKVRVRLVCLFSLAALAVNAGEPPGREAAPFYLGGIQVNEPDHRTWVQTLRGIGMNTVAVTVYAYQGDWDTDRLWYNEEEPSVLDEIRAAKSAGLNVVLILRVALDHALPRNRFYWHGMIMPSGDAAIESWFDQYVAFAEKWAAVAEAEGVDLLGIGSEMNELSATLPVTRWGNLKYFIGFRYYHRLQRKRALHFADAIEDKGLWLRGREDIAGFADYLDARLRHQVAWARRARLRDERGTFRKINARRALLDEQWVDLIRRVRRVYRGRLLYAANFDNYRSVGFWKHLDVIGINAYFPLRPYAPTQPGPDEKLALFERGWERVFAEIGAFSAGQDLAEMPVMLTELGYAWKRDSTVRPWSYEGFSVFKAGGRKHLIAWSEQPDDLDERRLALEALRRVHERHERRPLIGLLYWKLSTIERHREIEPFVLHVGPGSTDPLQPTLLGFVEGDRAPRSAVAISRAPDPR